MKKQLIRLGSRNPHLRPHIAKVLETLEGGRRVSAGQKSLLEDIITFPEWNELHMRYKHNRQVLNYLMEIRYELDERLRVDSNTQEALSRLRDVVSGRLKNSPDLEMNNIETIGARLGLKPSLFL